MLVLIDRGEPEKQEKKRSSKFENHKNPSPFMMFSSEIKPPRIVFMYLFIYYLFILYLYLLNIYSIFISITNVFLNQQN